MVRVDMNPTRQVISKRRLRRRRNAARRVARLKRIQQREILAAEAARQARCVAVAKWTEAEKQRDREQAHTPPDQPHRKPVVRFSPDVMITKIPHDVAQQLPEPVSSPMASPAPVGAPTGGGGPSRPAKFVTVGEDWSDEDSGDEEGDPEFLLVEGDDHVDSEVQRRIRPVRVGTVLFDQLDDIEESLAKPTSRFHPDDNRAWASGHGNMDSEHSKRKPHDSSRKLTGGQDRCGDPGPRKEINLNSTAELNAPHARSGIEGSASTASGKNATSAAVDHNDDTSDVSTGSPDSRKKKRKLNQRNGAASPSSSQSTAGSSLGKMCKLSSNGHLAHASNASLANGNSSGRSNSAADHADEEEEEIDNLFDGLVKQKAARKAARATVLEAEGGKAGDGEEGKVEGLRRGKETGPRYTEDGLRIVTYGEIAADQPKGLNGPCPFDCSCCF